jgi:hypothetical protein
VSDFRLDDTPLLKSPLGGRGVSVIQTEVCQGCPLFLQVNIRIVMRVLRFLGR